MRPHTYSTARIAKEADTTKDVVHALRRAGVLSPIRDSVGRYWYSGRDLLALRQHRERHAPRLTLPVVEALDALPEDDRGLVLALSDCRGGTR